MTLLMVGEIAMALICLAVGIYGISVGGSATLRCRLAERDLVAEKARVQRLKEANGYLRLRRELDRDAERETQEQFDGLVDAQMQATAEILGLEDRNRELETNISELKDRLEGMTG